MEPRQPYPVTPPQSGRRRGGLAFFTSPLVLTLLWLLAGIGVVAAGGGWAPTPSKQLPVVEFGPGQSALVDPFEITAVKAVWSDSIEPLRLNAEGMRYILVAFDVRNTMNFPVGINFLMKDKTTAEFGALATSDAPTPVASPLVRVSDNLPPNDLQPGLTARLAFVFEQPASAPPPEVVKFGLPAHTWRLHAAGHEWNWFDTRIAAYATMPVTKAGSQ